MKIERTNIQEVMEAYNHSLASLSTDTLCSFITAQYLYICNDFGFYKVETSIGKLICYAQTQTPKTEKHIYLGSNAIEIFYSDGTITVSKEREVVKCR